MVVNNIPFRINGTQSFPLSLGLCRSFPSMFIIAEVQRPILGADFLRHFGLLVDIKLYQMIEIAMHLHIQGVLSFDLSPSPSICPKNVSNAFPALTQICFPDSSVNHGIYHHMKTTGPSVSAHLRCLALHRLSVGKQDFEHMLQLAIILPSSKAWFSPLRMVPKKTTGDWYPCGDYQALNLTTFPDCYPVPHIYDFSSVLQGAAIFPQFHLVHTFCQIPFVASKMSIMPLSQLCSVYRSF